MRNSCRLCSMDFERRDDNPEMLLEPDGLATLSSRTTRPNLKCRPIKLDRGKRNVHNGLRTTLSRT